MCAAIASTVRRLRSRFTRGRPAPSEAVPGSGRSTRLRAVPHGGPRPFGDELVGIILLAVTVSLLALGQLHLVARHRLVRDMAEEMRDDVQARAPLVVGADDVPGCPGGVRRLEHR